MEKTTQNSLFPALFFLLFAFSPAEGSTDEAALREIPRIERQPLHYKYAAKTEIWLDRDEDGLWPVPVSAENPEIVTLHYAGATYPILIGPEEPVRIHIDRGRFPLQTRVEGFSSELNERYQQYLPREQELRREIRREMAKFRRNEVNDVISLHRELIGLTKSYFEGTPFHDFIYRARGEYFVQALTEVAGKKNAPDFDAGEARQAILNEAVEMEFFTLESLKAQRAGIRDFTNAFSNTFGIRTRLREEHGASLLDYDLNRLGYEELNAARIAVFDYIEDEDARAHAEMYLTAERLGEAPFPKAEKAYFDFLEQYGEYDEYVDFLTFHYEGVKSVQPGRFAVPFAIEDHEGNIHTMDDYAGKYVLLDLWASWCVPCLNEFPHMERLYEKYDREDFEIVAISIEKDRQAWRNAVQRYDHAWPQLHDGDEFQQETFMAYRGGGIPFYILINREGLIERHNDIRASYNLEEVMDSLLLEESGLNDRRPKTGDREYQP